MKFTRLYTPVDEFLVRIPLLPSDTIEGGIEKFSTGHVGAAIAIGSPNLYRTIQNHKDSKSERYSASLQKYSKRMQFRPTPYGMFAGVASGQFGKITDLERGKTVSTSSRPDMSMLTEFIGKLESERSVRRHLMLHTNPEVFVRDGRVWCETIQTQESKIQKSNVRALKSVERALEVCRKGLYFGELARLLSSEFGVSLERAENLVNELVDLRILISGLRFALSDWMEVIDTLEQAYTESGHEKIHTLRRIMESINRWDANEIKTGNNVIELLDRIESLSGDQSNTLVQTDTHLELSNHTVSRTVGNEVSKAAELLLRLSTRAIFDQNIQSYLRRFVNHYQEGQEVPLLELLSPRFGLGSPYSSSRSRTDHGARDRKLLDLVFEATRRNSTVIELSTVDVEDLTVWRPNIESAPVSLDIFASIVASSREEIDKGNFELLIGSRVGEIGAGRGAGRFLPMLGKRAIKTVERVSAMEQAVGSSLLVDISFWTPAARASNVGLAPFSRSHCITINTVKPKASIEIPVSEIDIGVENDRFYARWRKTRQKLDAKSNNMLNVESVPETARFLLDIESFGRPKLGPFDWGVASSLPYLPRIVFGKTILQVSHWNLDHLRNKILQKGADKSALLREFIQQWHIPDTVCFAASIHDDNVLRLDLSRPEDRWLLIEEMKKSTSPVLLENISTDHWHTTEAGRFVTEFVFSVLRSDACRNSGSNFPTSDRGVGSIGQKEECTDQRPLGSEWIYIKFKSPLECHEELLSNLRVFGETLREKHLSEKYFFVRYFETDEHQIRIRFHTDTKKVFSKVLPVIVTWSKELLDSGLCRSFSIDTYEREAIRYGGKSGMDEVENLFCLNAKTILDLLHLAAKEKLDTMTLGILSMEQLLKAFRFDGETKMRILKYSVNEISKDYLSDEYRRSGNMLISLMESSSTDLKTDYEPVLKILNESYDKLRKIADNLHSLEAGSRLSRPIAEIMQSVVHMHCNRIFGISSRTEHTARALLSKCLKSMHKRNKEVASFELT